jgi:hypothetical protein
MIIAALCFIRACTTRRYPQVPPPRLSLRAGGGPMDNAVFHLTLLRFYDTS